MEDKLEKIYKLVIILTAIAAINLVIGLVLVTRHYDENNTVSKNETSESNDNYDVSSLNSVDINGLLKLFDKKKGYSVVYLGRSTCTACVNFLPTLKDAQKKYGFIANYLDITTVNTADESFDKLMDKLSKEVTLTVNGEESTQSFGNFYGYTPMTFIIKDGKFRAGIVGAYSSDKFEEFLNENGIK